MGRGTLLAAAEDGQGAEGAPAAQPGTLLDGRVRYRQFAHGYRTGIEPVLLAAVVPARAGARVLEAGAGAGAGLLCLAARLPGITGVGIERDPALAALCADNARANGWHDRLEARVGAIERDEWRRPGELFDHAMANPPWHHRAGPVARDPGRHAAKSATPGLLADWVHALAHRVRARGTISLILPAGELDRALAALAAARCGSVRILPLWPHEAAPARLIIVQAARGGRAPTRLLAGLVLHQPDGRFTAPAQRVLRAGLGHAM